MFIKLELLDLTMQDVSPACRESGNSTGPGCSGFCLKISEIRDCTVCSGIFCSNKINGVIAFLNALKDLNIFVIQDLWNFPRIFNFLRM